jgi:hypothetical protein
MQPEGCGPSESVNECGCDRLRHHRWRRGSSENLNQKKKNEKARAPGPGPGLGQRVPVTERDRFRYEQPGLRAGLQAPDRILPGRNSGH